MHLGLELGLFSKRASIICIPVSALSETDPLVCWVSWLRWSWVGVICNRLPLYIWTLPSYNPTSPQVERGNVKTGETNSDYQMTQKQIDSYFCSRGCKIILHLFCSKRALWWRGPILHWKLSDSLSSLTLSDLVYCPSLSSLLHPTSGPFQQTPHLLLSRCHISCDGFYLNQNLIGTFAIAMLLI